MSGLDMVLQRQVPARTVAKTGEAPAAADDSGSAGKEGFSAVLKGEKRSGANDRDRTDASAETEADTGADTVAEDAGAQPAAQQSDEILALLASLMSSTANPGEVKPDGQVDAAVEAEDGSTPAEAEIDAVAKAEIEAVAEAETAGDETGATDGDKVTAVAVKDDVPAETEAGEQVQAKSVPAGTAAPGPATAQAHANPNAAAALAAAPGISGRAGPAAQPQAQPQSADATPKGDKADAKDTRETMQVLGLSDAAPRSRDARSGSEEGFSGFARQKTPSQQSDKEMPGSRAGAVEVVESRRFMAPTGISANAQMLTRSLAEAGDAALSAQRAAPLQPTAGATMQPHGQMLHTLKLQLNPASLGHVTAVLKLSGEDLSVSLQVETAEAYRQLSDDNQSIVKALRAQGFGVEQITVQHVASMDRSNNASSQQQQQSFQPGSQDTGAGDARSSSNGDGGGRTGGQGSNQQGGQTREHAAYTTPGPARSDGVYL